jgi:hypothetical protein
MNMTGMTKRKLAGIKTLRDPDYTLSRVPNTVRQSIAEVIEDQATALERAYGILWRMPDAATGHTRKLLLECIDQDGQKRGIAYALEMFGPATEVELMKVVT